MTNPAEDHSTAILPQTEDGYRLCPDLLTEEELIRFLRLPEISRARNLRYVIDNLKRMHNLPRIHLCNKTLYPLKAIRTWIETQTTTGK